MAKPKKSTGLKKSVPPTVRSGIKVMGAKCMDIGRGDKLEAIMKSNERNDHLQQSKLVKFPFLFNLNPLFGNSMPSALKSNG